MLSLDSGVIIIYEPNISGSVTLQADADLEKLLDLILMPYNYYWTKIDDVYFVGVSNVNSQSFFNTARLYQIPLKFSASDKIASAMPKAFSDFILASTDQKTLLVFAPPPIASKIADFVSSIDKPLRAYEIYIKIVDVSESFLSSFVLNISTSQQIIFAPNLLQVPILNTNLLFLINSNTGSEDFQIVYEGKVKALNGSQTKISSQKSTTVMKYVDGKLTTSQNVSTIEISLIPRFLSNRCSLDVFIKIEGIPYANELNFETKGASLQSTVSLDYGKPYIIGSFSYDRALQKEGGITFLKDLPIIGSIFKKYYFESEKRYVMFLVMVGDNIEVKSKNPDNITLSGVDKK